MGLTTSFVYYLYTIDVIPRDISHGEFIMDMELSVNVENLNRYNAKNN